AAAAAAGASVPHLSADLLEEDSSFSSQPDFPGAPFKNGSGFSHGHYAASYASTAGSVTDPSYVTVAHGVTDSQAAAHEWAVKAFDK
ncbi:hypothetical protein T492DRAFT_877332, partial [Pavlovales sp. CCMP2436]